MKNTLLIVIDEQSNLENSLKVPAEILSQNGTVIFPTETVYGLGANALDDAAVKKIYEAKGRPSDNPLIVHITDISMLSQLAIHIRPYVYELVHAFWPGPITFILEKHPDISAKVTGGLNTIAVRMPNNKIATKLIQLSGKPIAAPSANRSGKPSPTSGKFVVKDMMSRVDCIIDGGECEVGLESTVVDVTGEVPIVLRPGKITAEHIESVVGNCIFDQAITSDRIDDDGKAISPGMKYKHYAPEGDVYVYVGYTTKIIKILFSEAQRWIECKKKIGILTFQEDLAVLEKLFNSNDLLNHRIELISAGSAKDWTAFGKVLFESLRLFDELGCEVILIRGVEDIGIGQAIMNRLKKASDGKITRI